MAFTTPRHLRPREVIAERHVEGYALSGTREPHGRRATRTGGEGWGSASLDVLSLPKARTAGNRTRDLRMSGNATLVTTRLPCPLNFLPNGSAYRDELWYKLWGTLWAYFG